MYSTFWKSATRCDCNIAKYPYRHITETNKLVYTTATVILDLLGHDIRPTMKEHCPPWSRRLEAKVKITETENSQLSEKLKYSPKQRLITKQLQLVQTCGSRSCQAMLQSSGYLPNAAIYSRSRSQENKQGILHHIQNVLVRVVKWHDYIHPELRLEEAKFRSRHHTMIMKVIKLYISDRWKKIA